MRQLTVKQKKLLDTVYRESKGGITSVEELPIEIWDRLEEINDTEILYQEVNRYLYDKHFDTVYK